jgi:hypothetical protein
MRRRKSTGRARMRELRRRNRGKAVGHGCRAFSTQPDTLGGAAPPFDRPTWNPNTIANVGGDHGQAVGDTGGRQPQIVRPNQRPGGCQHDPYLEQIACSCTVSRPDPGCPPEPALAEAGAGLTATATGHARASGHPGAVQAIANRSRQGSGRWLDRLAAGESAPGSLPQRRRACPDLRLCSAMDPSVCSLARGQNPRHGRRRG